FLAAVVLQKGFAALGGVEHFQKSVGLGNRVGRRLVVGRRGGAGLGQRAGRQRRRHGRARGVHREAEQQDGAQGRQQSNCVFSSRALVRQHLELVFAHGRSPDE